LEYYYPTQTLVTGPDIIFFWVARMVMAGYEYLDQKPFEKVYFTGLIRDKQGRKMSKQLGNSPDLLQLIEDHGADAVRFSVLIASPAGNDILYDEAFLEQGRNFINKMWNALKLIKIWEEKVDTQDNTVSFASQWMQEKIKSTRKEAAILFDEFKLNEALKTIYSLIWNDYCSWYLEWIKPASEASMGQKELELAKENLSELMLMLHPFLPFITESIYQELSTTQGSILEQVRNEYPKANTKILAEAQLLQALITAVRDVRNKQQLKQKETIELFYESEQGAFYEKMNAVLCKQINATQISPVNPNTDLQNLHALVVENEKLFIKSNAQVDVAQQKAQLEQDLAYLKGFLNAVEKKLSNERFVANAKPEIVATEQKKKEDALAKIQTIEKSLEQLN